jgi:hypothetical protein
MDNKAYLEEPGKGAGPGIDGEVGMQFTQLQRRAVYAKEGLDLLIGGLIDTKLIRLGFEI